MSTIINPGDSLSPHEKIEALFVSREENGEAGDSRDQEFAKFLSCQRMCNARVLQILRGESHYLEEWETKTSQITIEKISGCAVEVLPYQGQKLYIVGEGRYLNEQHIDILHACALELHSPSYTSDEKSMSEDDIKRCLRSLTFLAQSFPHLSHDGRSFVNKFLKLESPDVEASRIVSDIRKIRKENKGATIEAVVDML